MIYIPKQTQYESMLGEINIETFAMPKCACVACNSCSCGCSCRVISRSLNF